MSLSIDPTNPVAQPPQAAGASKKTVAAKADKAVTAKNMLGENMNNFLTLLTKQLEYQDPLSPMDNAEFTQQLVSFSIAEQAIENNKLLRDLVQEQKSSTWLSQLALMGKEVEIDGDPRRAFDGKNVDFTFSLPNNVDKAELRIFDANNKLAQIMPLDRAPGKQSIQWDGSTLIGPKASPGVYQFKVLAKDEKGNTITPENIKLRGVIDHVDVSQGITPMIGGIPIDPKKISRFYNSLTPKPNHQ